MRPNDWRVVENARWLIPSDCNIYIRSDTILLSQIGVSRFRLCLRAGTLTLVLGLPWHSHISGRLLLAVSWSPSFNTGITTDSFRAEGKTDVKSDLFISSVRTGSITGRASLITLMCNLSIPGALFEGKDTMILRTSKVVTARNRNSSSWNSGLSWGVLIRWKSVNWSKPLRFSCSTRSHRSKELVELVGQFRHIS